MIYIHKLTDLNPKSAEIESVPVIRDIRKKAVFPLDGQKFYDEIYELFMTEADKERIKNALPLIDSAINELVMISADANPVFEPINLKRAATVLNELIVPIKNNIRYAEEIERWKTKMAYDFTNIINKLPNLRTSEDKIDVNNTLKDIFSRILRNPEFFFNGQDIINEATVEHITALEKSMMNGFLFHVSLEQELKKERFEEIRKTLPGPEVQRSNNITSMISEIKRGVDRAYESNLRMVNLSVILYSYFKMVAKK